MQTLPNGLRVFNATPHPITFWREDWQDVVTVESDIVINATVSEKLVALDVPENELVQFVTPTFSPDSDNTVAILKDYREKNIYVIGSIIAAQAYPGLVFGMIPAPGYERVAPAEKRMRPDKFTIF